MTNFLQTRPQAPVSINFNFWDVKNKDEAKWNGVAPGEHYFYMPFGAFTTLKKNTAITEKDVWAEINIPDGFVFNYQLASLNIGTKLVDGEKKQVYAHWHVVPSTDPKNVDPIVELGYTNAAFYSAAPDLKKQPAEFQSYVDRIESVLGWKRDRVIASLNNFVNNSVHVPVGKVFTNSEGEIDNTTIQWGILKLPKSQVKSIVEASAAIAKAKSGNNPFGLLFTLKKDPTLGMKTYQWTVAADYKLADIEGIDARQMFADIAKNDSEKQTKIFADANGNEWNTDNVRRYLIQLSGLANWSEFYQKFNVNLKERLVTSEVVGFSTDDVPFDVPDDK